MLPPAEERVLANCGGTLERVAVELRWDEFATVASALSNVDSLGVTAVNQAGMPVRVEEIHITGDAGGSALTAELGSLKVAADEEISFSIELDGLSIKREAMQVSGAIVVEASLFREDGSTLGRTSTPALYFHPTPNSTGFEIYGEEVMRSEHAAGDYLAAALDGEPPNPRRRRLMQGSFELVGDAQ